jgi:hypothetical protein
MLRIRSRNGTDATWDGSYALGAGGWKRLGRRTLRGYRYPASRGPIRAVDIMTRKSTLLVTGRGDGLRIVLDSDPAPVGVTLTIDTMRYCMSFGGEVKFQPGRRYLAVNAGPPETCP